MVKIYRLAIKIVTLAYLLSVHKEIPKQFFKLRLWDANDVIKEIFNNYEKLPIEIRTEIPLKQVWVLNLEEK